MPGRRGGHDAPFPAEQGVREVHRHGDARSESGAPRFAYSLLDKGILLRKASCPRISVPGESLAREERVVLVAVV